MFTHIRARDMAVGLSQVSASAFAIPVPTAFGAFRFAEPDSTFGY